MTNIRFQLSEQEAISGMLKIWRVAMSLNKLYLALILLLALDVLLGLRSHQRNLPTFPIYLTCGCGIVIFICLLPVLIRLAVARFVRAHRTLLTDPQELSFDAERIVSRSRSLTQELAWSVFKMRLEDEQCFYLCTSGSGMAAIVPKRAFDEVSLREFLRCSQNLISA